MECELCLCSFQADSFHAPLLLPCGHTFCSSCMHQLFESSVTSSCPNCSFLLTQRNLQLFSQNYSFIQSVPTLSVNLHDSPQQTMLVCEVCPTYHPGECNCIDCGEIMCEPASQIHLRSRASRHHTLISLDEYLEQRKSRAHLNMLFPKQCAVHESPYEYWRHESVSPCVSLQLLCSYCVKGEVQVGRLGSSSSTASLMEETLTGIREHEGQAKQRLGELKVSSQTSRLVESKEQALGEIHSSFLGLREALSARERELEQAVEEQFKASLFEIEDQKERSCVWEGHLCMLLRCVEEVESLMRDSRPSSLQDKGLLVDMCLLERALRNALHATSSEQSPVDPVRDTLSFGPSPSLSPSTASRQIPYSISHKLIDLVNLSDWTRLISTLGSVRRKSSFPLLLSPSTSCSSSPNSLVDWSQNHVRPVRTFYRQGSGVNQLMGPRCIQYSIEEKMFYVYDSSGNIGRIQRFRLDPVSQNSLSVEQEGDNLCISMLSPFQFTPTTHSWIGFCVHQGLIYLSNRSKNLIEARRINDFKLVRSMKTHSCYSMCIECSQNHPECTIEGIAVIDNNIYLLDSLKDRIVVLDAEDGRPLLSFGPGPSTPLRFPKGILAYGDLLFVCDLFTLIYVYRKDGSFLYCFGSRGEGLGQLSSPKGMVMVEGRLYVVEFSNHRIQVFEQSNINSRKNT